MEKVDSLTQRLAKKEAFYRSKQIDDFFFQEKEISSFKNKKYKIFKILFFASAILNIFFFVLFHFLIKSI